MGSGFVKKFLAVVLTLFVLASGTITASAAGSISLKGPSTVRAGDTITLTFSAGGGIYGGSGSVSFDSSKLTLKSYTAAIGGNWAVEFSGNKFVFYDNNMSTPIKSAKAIFKATFTVNKSLKPGAEIAVSVSGVKLSDGSKDMSMGSRTYKTTLAQPKSGDCTLASLTVSGVKLSPAFSEKVTSYTASVPFETASVKVTAKANHKAAKVSVKNTNLKAGATTNVTVKVTAENGKTKTYTIKVKRAQDPNYVPSGNNNLKELTVEGAQLSPKFSPEVKAYYVWLPYETDKLTVQSKAEDTKAKVTVDMPAELAVGKTTTGSVTVTAENGKAQVYTITAFRAPAPENVEAFLAGKDPEPETTVPETTIPETLPEETAPAQPQPDRQQQPAILLVAGGLLCLVAGMALGILLKPSIDKRKQ